MRMFIIPADGKENFAMVAKTIFGLEQLCEQELKKLGAENTAIHNRAVSFEGNLGVMYKANLLLRTALRVLVQFAEFEVQDEHERRPARSAQPGRDVDPGRAPQASRDEA